MVSVQNCFFAQNIMAPLFQRLHQAVEFFFIGTVIDICSQKVSQSGMPPGDLPI
jgi:hypothetical protein